MNKARCAIYTRKSSEDGLEQEFNSLDAQREACAAFIASQKIEGWVLVPDQYDDGGLSGGTLERPALQRLLADMRAGKIDRVVVYKIDRLTRSLADFAKIVDTLDAAGATFVSVTQSFNTATSMGRLTLNMLLSFAQFEREVTAERIRDKITASKKKGLWMGGNVPLGYTPVGRTLEVCEPEAQIIRKIYDLYDVEGTVRQVKVQVDLAGLKTAVRTSASGRRKGGADFSLGHLYHILTNPIYAGRIRHKAQVYPGQHPAIIEPDRWDALQERLSDAAAVARVGKERGQGRPNKKQVSLLVGRVFDETGDRLSPSHTKSAKGRRLRYYISHRLMRSKDPTAWRLPALELEAVVAKLVQSHLILPKVMAGLIHDATAEDILHINQKIEQLCKPAYNEADESHKQLLTLPERVDLKPGQISISLSKSDLCTLLDTDPDRLNTEHLELTSEFQMRKRGVETKLILNGVGQQRDVTLIKNIAKARRYLDMIIAGQSYADIAAIEGVSKYRIQKLINFAFLAPDVMRDVCEGKQPTALTTEWLLQHPVAPIWQDQRSAIQGL